MAKRRARKVWSSKDVSKLQALAKKKTPAAVIAQVLKRTEGATRQKACSIGLSLESRHLTYGPSAVTGVTADQKINFRNCD